MFRFLLEAQDNLALFTVVDRVRGVLLLRYSPSHEAEVDRFLLDATAVMPIQAVLKPIP